MIKVPTVLILGAGTSVHVGYPLGGSLISELSQRPFPSDGNDLLSGKWKLAEVNEFIKRLSRSGHYSIDAFLEENLEQLELGRFLIARQMKQHEDVKRLFPPHNSGWYQYLFAKLVENDPRAEKFQENALSIITFNYDRSLECYLHEVLQSRCRLSVDEATARLKGIRIIHPHGMLGSYPEISYQMEASTDELMKIANEIKIIHELKHTKVGFCSPDFEMANECLLKAERVFFLGFGFHIDNIRRFNFFEPKALNGKEVLGTTFGLGPADLDDLSDRIDEFGITREMLKGYNCDIFFSHVTRLR